MLSGFSSLVSPCRLVERLAPFSCLICHHGVRSLRGPGLAVLPVDVSSWRGVIRLSCGVASCLPLSFACRLARFSSFRLVWRLVARSPCPAGLCAVACLFVSSWSCCSRGAWLVVVPGRLAVLTRLVSGCSSRLVGRGVMFVSYGVSFPRLGERGGFGFSFYPGGGGGAAALVLSAPGRDACLSSLSSGGRCGDTVLVIGVPSCYLSSYGCGSIGSVGRSYSLVSIARLEATGRGRDGGLLGLSACGSSCLVNECI